MIATDQIFPLPNIPSASVRVYSDSSGFYISNGSVLTIPVASGLNPIPFIYGRTLVITFDMYMQPGHVDGYGDYPTLLATPAIEVYVYFQKNSSGSPIITWFSGGGPFIFTSLSVNGSGDIEFTINSTSYGVTPIEDSSFDQIPVPYWDILIKVTQIRLLGAV